MHIKTNLAVMAFIVSLLFNGCTKDLQEYNKPALYWYSKLVESVSDSNLERADNYYSSLQGEHIGSPLLPEATMILAIAHMHNEEYLLSEYFFDEYVKRYANQNEKEFAEFMKIKAKYMALPNPRRDQVLINEAIKDARKFKNIYAGSMYYSMVDAMMTNLYMADAALNATIVDLYNRVDKPKSAAYYKSLQQEPWIKWNEIEPANSSWYRSWFEGDGSESWYGFMVPDTQSVVSRNSSNDSNSSD